MNNKINLLEFTYDQLFEFVRGLGASASAAKELWKGLYRSHETDFNAIAGLSLSLKKELTETARVGVLEPLEEIVSSDAQTTKILFGLEDGKTIESTLMFFKNPGTGKERRTVCVSSQVGCPVGCQFCATGQQGFERDLTSGEIIAQVLFFVRQLDREVVPAERKKPHNLLTNVVFMGMGEPLANWENVRWAISIMNSPIGLNMGVRQITLSTSGMVPEILQLARENIQCQLALSLHAATDELRQRLVPIGRKFPLQELMLACDEYSAVTGRNVYIEYALFNKINDSSAHADELIALLGKHGFPVNLIPCNETTSHGFDPAPIERAYAFQKRLIDGGIRAMLRVSRGTDIEAGCGQLKSRWLATQ